MPSFFKSKYGDDIIDSSGIKAIIMIKSLFLSMNTENRNNENEDYECNKR